MSERVSEWVSERERERERESVEEESSCIVVLSVTFSHHT